MSTSHFPSLVDDEEGLTETISLRAVVTVVESIDAAVNSNSVAVFMAMNESMISSSVQNIKALGLL